jgi:hypothetical protein
MSETLKRFLWLISIAAWAAVLLRLLLIADKCQWDFDVYYFAAKVHSSGLNPYDPYQLCEAAGRWAPQILFFPYFPISIFFFKPFTLLSLGYAKYLFLLIKYVLLIYLLLLWQTRFLKDTGDPFFALFALLAFNAAIFLDLRSGNVTIIEQAALWSALLAFVKKKVWCFAVLVLLAAVFKITPLLFAGLLFLDQGRARGRLLIILIIGIGIICFIAWLADPRLIWQFLLSMSTWTGGDRFFLNILNPSALSLVTFLSQTASKATGILVPRALQWCLYFCFVAGVVVVSYRAFMKLEMENSQQRVTAVCLACLVYALALPRFQDYQWILILFPTYFVMVQLDTVKAYPVIFILAIISAEHQTLPGSAFLFGVFWNYYPLVVGFVIWVILVRKIEKDSATTISAGNSLVSSNLP